MSARAISHAPTACKDARKLAALAPDDELPLRELSRLHEHLGSCRSCQDFADAILRTTQALRAAASGSTIRVDVPELLARTTPNPAA